MTDTTTTTKVLTAAELGGLAETRFGADPRHWAYLCPGCGDVATDADFEAVGMPGIAGRECIGRDPRMSPTPAPEGLRGCDRAAYEGDAPWAVVIPGSHGRPDRTVPTFALADKENPVPDIDLGAIRARANAATPGPWKVTTDICECAHPCGHLPFPVAFGPFSELAHEDATRAAADIEFAAHARQDIPALLAEVDRKEHLRQELAAELDRVRDELAANTTRADRPDRWVNAGSQDTLADTVAAELGGYYALDPDGRTRPVSLDEWVTSSDPATRRIDRTEISDDVSVSTVFLSIDHQHDPDGPPLLFETMIFGGPYNQDCWRWSTRDQAVAGHQRVVEALRDGRAPETTPAEVAR